MATEIKTERLKKLLMELAAGHLNEESNRQSLITITGVSLSNKNRRAVFLLSIMPEEAEKAALFFAKRQRSALREKIKRETRMKFIPTVDFEIDAGEKNRRKIDDISRNV